MATEILINAGREETRVALLENGLVTELYIDRRKGRGIAGNVYKGRVVKVLPGMQAAFVDIGMEKAAFLYVADIYNTVEEYARLMEEEIGEEAGHAAIGGEEEETPPEAAAEEEESADLAEKPERRRYPLLPIEEILQEGQEILVQVSKEPLGRKGARVTSYITLPGRYLVFMPTVDHVGVSRRISDEEERRRLRDLILRMRRAGTGYIVRTMSEGRSEEELRTDLDFLDNLWTTIQRKCDRLVAPSLLHSDLDLVFRTVRDLFTPDVARLVVDSPYEFKRVKDFVETYLPDLSAKVEIHDREEPLYDAYGVEIEISRALGRRVWLKSGGYIVIDQTEALTAIDVNTGRYVGKRNLEETILKTNLEAVREIAYQLRLRNIGGIIIIDFIDMEQEENRKRVHTALQESLARDKAKTTIFQISELGLVQMTRKRIRESLGRTLCEPCPYCEGKAYVKSAVTVCYELFREIRRKSLVMQEKKILVAVHPDVADLLYDEERQEVEELEREINKKIIVKADASLHREQHELAFQ